MSETKKYSKWRIMRICRSCDNVVSLEQAVEDCCPHCGHTGPFGIYYDRVPARYVYSKNEQWRWYTPWRRRWNRRVEEKHGQDN